MLIIEDMMESESEPMPSAENARFGFTCRTVSPSRR